MIDVSKNITYWINTADNDIETAEILFASGKLIEGMFFCHLTIEKILKALVVKQTEEIPVRSHDLFRLIDVAVVKINDEQATLVQILMKYQLEGSYPEFYPKTLSREKANDYYTKTKELLLCFKKML
jgi:HEPN domain-containing protein